MLKYVLYKEIFLSFTTKTKYYFLFHSMISFPFPILELNILQKAFIKHEILSK